VITPAALCNQSPRLFVKCGMSSFLPPAAFYRMTVMHRRHVAPLYRFIYRIFYLWIDLDRLSEANGLSRWLSVNRWNVWSFYERDHGSKQKPQPLREWAEELLAGVGVDLAGGRISLLTMPRVLGMVFNPISLFYCHHADGSLRAVIVEVNNTFGERHCYLLSNAGQPMPDNQVWCKDKCFHVSPLFDLVGQYRFTVPAPRERLRVIIHETREGKPLIDATMAGPRVFITNRSIVLQTLKLPFLTLYVLWGIHWQAVKLLLRGAKFHKKPEPPTLEVS
jgi:hypothetical protein